MAEVLKGLTRFPFFTNIMISETVYRDDDPKTVILQGATGFFKLKNECAFWDLKKYCAPQDYSQYDKCCISIGELELTV